jgi:hypothetical protein
VTLYRSDKVTEDYARCENEMSKDTASNFTVQKMSSAVSK